MKRILVTGGAGFIGSQLCKRLVQGGHDVICVDNLFTSTKRNILPLLKYDNFEFVRHDVCLPLYVEVDEIYNLACPASPKWYKVDPIQTMKSSVLGIINMLGLAKRCKARILQTSTSEVYGDPDVGLQGEDYIGRVNPLFDRSCYAMGKKAAETLLMDYHRMHGIEVRLVRIFNTYGPGMAIADGRVVSNFITQTLRGEPCTIYGDGKQTRSFCYVDDIVEGLIKMMNIDGGFVGPINLGKPVEHTMLQLAEIVTMLMDRECLVKYLPPPTWEPLRRCPDITRAKEILGWEPTTALEDGLLKTIDYFKAIL